MEQNMEDARERLRKYLDLYLEKPPAYRSDGRINEFEVRFGTHPKFGKVISKIDYDNVVKQALAAGFMPVSKEGVHSLRMEYFDTRAVDNKKYSKTRVEIQGVDFIQEYCRTNSLQKLVLMPNYKSSALKFRQKNSVQTKAGEWLNPIDFPDMNYRVSYMLEKEYDHTSAHGQSIIRGWDDYKKKFRMMNRLTLKHPSYPIQIDLSIVKTSKQAGRADFPTYTVQEANVFNNVEHYEIELEIINEEVGYGTLYPYTKDVLEQLRKVIRIVLTGIQGSNYPIGYNEQNTVLNKYMVLLYGKEEASKMKPLPRFFIGPDSCTLQLENIGELEEDSLVPNIRKGYTVTDKADGERRLLFIDDEGKIYLIDKSMNVMFSGMKTPEKTVFGSILDGEHIRYDKHHKYINVYAAFDIYYYNGKSVREFGFIPNMSLIDPTDKQPLKQNYRLPLLENLVKSLKAENIVSGISKTQEINSACFMRIQTKEFYTGDENIFDGCNRILSNEELFEYNTDGLIFTPAFTGVCSHSEGHAGPLKKQTWDASFKWKPAEYNTVDFLVSVVKDKSGKDRISHLYQEGKNTQQTSAILRFKTLELRCGYNSGKYVSADPFTDLINGKLPDFSEMDEATNKYEPRPFQPTNPYDPDACFCNILIDQEDNMFTEETHDYFEESMIVEFKYNVDAEPHWRWIPLRVRYDKTMRLRGRDPKNNRDPEYGNDYKTADGNWHSIHYPVTREMIMTGQNIPELGDEKDVYYNMSKQESKTIAMRNFHNLYVKRKLIMAVSNTGDKLIDYAVGKAGDLDKWVQARLGFVFGIDISEDNIRNPLNGACARYLGKHRTTRNLFKALFIKGNSSQNIRSIGDAFPKDSKERAIAQAVFGKGPKDEHALGQSVYRAFGVGEGGFHVSSCQFAMHYFFENHKSLHGFLRNLQECTKVQGYYVGTCYDGQTIFNLLEKKSMDEGIAITVDIDMVGKKKICEIVKKYPDTSFPDNENSIGYRIEVFQETINKSFSEYLVNFKYFKQLMEVYGFTLITDDEARQMGLPSATGLFDKLFDSMVKDVRSGKMSEEDFKEALNMSPEEKNISFLNRYFVFRKFADVESSKLTKIFASQIRELSEFDAQNPEDVQELELELEKQERSRPAVKGTVKKLKAKLVLRSKVGEELETIGQNVNDSDSEEEDQFEIKVKEQEPEPEKPEKPEKIETEEKESEEFAKPLLSFKKVSISKEALEKMKQAKAKK